MIINASKQQFSTTFRTAGQLHNYYSLHPRPVLMCAHEFQVEHLHLALWQVGNVLPLRKGPPAPFQADSHVLYPKPTLQCGMLPLQKSKRERISSAPQANSKSFNLIWWPKRNKEKEMVFW